jgi:hypothetical protein
MNILPKVFLLHIFIVKYGIIMHFEINPILKKNLLKSVFVPKSTLIFIIEGLTNRWIVLVIDVVTACLVLPICRTRVYLLYVIMKLLMTYHRGCLKSSTRRVSHVEQEMFTLPVHRTWVHPGFNGARVARFLAYCVMSCCSLFVLLFFSSGHSIVYPSN